MKKIILYSHGCPKCKVLDMKLHKKNIEFETDTNVSKLIDLGFKSAPILQVGDKYMTFEEAVKWVNNI